MFVGSLQLRKPEEISKSLSVQERSRGNTRVVTLQETLSLSHTHTHTHTQMNNRRRENIPKLWANSSSSSSSIVTGEVKRGGRGVNGEGEREREEREKERRE